MLFKTLNTASSTFVFSSECKIATGQESHSLKPENVREQPSQEPSLELMSVPQDGDDSLTEQAASARQTLYTRSSTRTVFGIAKETD